MLFNSSIRKELAQTFAAILAVLLTIVITVMLIRTLGMASKGAVSPKDVLLVLGYVIMGYVPILLSLTLFLTIVYVLGRMYRDSEMVIWQGAGAGTLRLVGPIFAFTWPIILGIAVLMIFVWPWSNSQITTLGLQFQQQSEITRIQPGEFQISSNLKRVAFIEQQNQPKSDAEYPEGKNVFLYTNDFLNEKLSIITAETAHVETIDDEKYLIFKNGQQLEFNHKTRFRTLLNFDRYSILLSETQEVLNPVQRSKEIPTQELLQDATPAKMGELAWRLGLIIASINFILLAIPLGYANPRVGRNTNMLYALLTFVIYFNLINLSRSWISSDKVGILTAMLLIHGIMLALAVTFLLLRHYDLSIFPKARIKRKSKENNALKDAEDKSKGKNKDGNNATARAIKQIKRSAGWGPLPTVRRLFYAEIGITIILVSLGFLSLFFFFDFIDDIGDIERKGYQFYHVLLNCLLQVPAHLYELMPIVILIGTIFVLARMAQSSEFTILRTSGMSPRLALKLLAGVGFVGALLTFILGDVIVPLANSTTNQIIEKIYADKGSPLLGNAHAAWIRDRDENYTYSVTVFQESATKLKLVNIYAFNQKNQLVNWTSAPTATIQADGTWLLENAMRSTLSHIGEPNASIIDEPAQNITWANNLDSNMVSIATSKNTGMHILNLYRFIQHLSNNAQASDIYIFNLWQKIIYPFSCLVMVMLALPFGYLHFRSGGISTKVFSGIMIGISFVVVNSMFGHLGQLRHWPPLISAGMPSLLYLLASLSVFSWLVKNR